MLLLSDDAPANTAGGSTDLSEQRWVYLLRLVQRAKNRKLNRLTRDRHVKIVRADGDSRGSIPSHKCLRGERL